MRRLAIVLGGLGAVLASLAGAFAAPAGATVPRADADAAAPPVNVVQISGFLDPITLDEWTRAIDRAETSGAVALVVQLNSKGSVLSAKTNFISGSPQPSTRAVSV